MTRLCFKILVMVFILLQNTPTLFAQTIFKEGSVIGSTGLSLPRFVSLSAGEANLRTGPGDRYPILWVYVKRGIPLEIIAEYNVWRRVRDSEGTTGWMHSALLSGTRFSLITGSIRTVYANPSVSSKPVLRVEPNVISSIKSCKNGWCFINITSGLIFLTISKGLERVTISKGLEGWIPQEHIWGTYSFENIK
ncbi:MAG: SH3 domain-containing protein [Sphingomonadales bacterium]|jgi:SH3-like domain-containing protein